MDKSYRRFLDICKITSINEDYLRNTILKYDGKAIKITAHNQETNMSFRIVVDSKMKEEYLLSVYELHCMDESKSKGKIIFRNWTRLQKPRKKMPAISEILGMIILMSVAVTAAAGFYMVAVNHAENEDADIDVLQADVIVFPGDGTTTDAILRLEFRAFPPSDVKISGGLASDITVTGESGTLYCTEDLKNGGTLCDDGTREVSVTPLNNGLLFHYEATLKLDKNYKPGQTINIVIENSEINHIENVIISKP